MSSVGLKITDRYCNGFVGRRYDLEGKDRIVIRIDSDRPEFLNLQGYYKQYYINMWTASPGE